MSVTIKSGVGSDVQTVGAVSKAGYVELRDNLGAPLAMKHRDIINEDQHAIIVAGKNDDTTTFMRTDRKGNQMIGNYVPELIENFEGATVNVQRWTATSTTFVPAQSTLAGYNFNSTSLTTLSAVSILQSQRLFVRSPRIPMQLKSRLRHSLVSGAIADFGFGVPATTTLIVPNGVCFRMTTSGTIKGVLTLNSVEIAIGDIASNVGSNGNTIGSPLNMSNAYYTSGYFVYDIIIDDDNAVFTVQDTFTGEIIGELSLPVPKDQIKMWGATALPVYYRVYNNTAPSTAPVFAITELQTLTTDWGVQPDMSQVAGNLGLSAGRNPFTGAQLENHTNSTAPTSATLSNTAAGYSTLGGRFQFAAVAGAVTDFALFAIAIPAGSRFLCEGIHIETYNTGAAVATTASVLEWAMGFNSSAVSLATANIVRRQVGVQSFPIGAAIGAVAAPIDVNFVTPEVVESGRFLHVILNLPIGTATASQVIRGVVQVKGRFI
jgi:hypothetical protein